ncbi:MAG TPA: hypothetical protein VMD59_02420 [Acidimicrobiales bacterium]|nr:hypothetical protein [Acidimicrobiales bacterium]
MEQYLAERSTDVQGFVVLRSSPEPHGVLVVSPETPLRAREEDGDSVSPWLDLLLKQGFVPVGPDVMDVRPARLPDWRVDVVDGFLTCGTNDRLLISGALEVPEQWRAAVREEGQCVVLVAALGVSSNELGPDFDAALNSLASGGLVACAAVAAGAV